MRRLIRFLGPPLWLAVGVAAACAGTAERVGAIRGGHGPPAVVDLGNGSGLVVAHVVREGKDADLFAWRVSTGPTEPRQLSEGFPVCTAPGDQLSPVAVADGAGGAIVAWMDYRGGRHADVYAQHVPAAELADPAWPANGLQLNGVQRSQLLAQPASDGAGGAFIAWEVQRGGAYDVRFTHVLAGGGIDSKWPTGGLPVSAGSFARTSPVLIADGSGGVIVVWDQENVDSGFDVLAQRFDSDGSSHAAWPEGGLVICAESGDQIEPRGVADGEGGAVISWIDNRSAEATRIYATRVLSSGEHAPGWTEAGTRVCSADGMQRYPSLVGDGHGGAFIAWQDGRVRGAECVFLHHLLASGELDPNWPEHGTAAGASKGLQVSPRLGFADEKLVVTWLERQSAERVQGFAQRIGLDGAVDPAWPRSGARLSTEPMDGLVLSAASAGSAFAAWRVTATWIVQRILLAAEPPDLEGTPGEPLQRAALLAPSPNPSRGDIVFRFSLGERLHASMVVFDVQGRRVATLLDGTFTPGPHQVTWNRRSARGVRARPGMYFVRFEAGDQRFTRRFVVVR